MYSHVHVMFTSLNTCIYMYFDVCPVPHPVKDRLEAATSFMILGMIATLASLVLFFPFFHWILFIVGAIVSFASSKWVVLSKICFAVIVALHKVPLSLQTVHYYF